MIRVGNHTANILRIVFVHLMFNESEDDAFVDAKQQWQDLLCVLVEDVLL